MATDNHNIAAKLSVRRMGLRAWRQAHPRGRLRVLDCFAGEQVMWEHLREEFPVEDYLSFDLKPRRGRLKLDSLRFLKDRDWDHNVIDLDAYGSPWSHWHEVLKRGAGCLVFLTVGGGRHGFNTRLSADALTLAGVPQSTPFGMHRALAPMIMDRCLAACYGHGLEPAGAWEAPNPAGNARYLAVHLVAVAPRKAA